MAFGIGVNTQGSNAGQIRGIQIEIACECWFTSTGNTKPLMIKFKDEEGGIQTITQIQIHFTEDKNYAGIPSVEYDTTIIYGGIQRKVKLIFFKEECRWIMRI